MKKNLLFPCLLFWGISGLFASGVTGGHIGYKYLGNKQYRITGVIHRECSGTSLGIPEIKAFSGSTSYNLTVTRTSITDVSQVCSKIQRPCNPANTQTSKGIEMHVFEADIDFGVSPYNMFTSQGNCQVNFSMEACCRSQVIGNMSAGKFYIEAFLDLCELKNEGNSTVEKTSPDFMQTCFSYPVRYYFSGQDKTDHDSFLFVLTNPKFHKDSLEVFYRGLSAQIPFTPYCPPNIGDKNCQPLPNAYPPKGFYFETLTGNIVFTPVTTADEGVFQLRVNEYRKIDGLMKLVGFSTHEIYLFISNCPDNYSPYFLGSNNYSVCEGNKLCFKVTSGDDAFLPAQTMADTVQLGWDAAIPAASFRILNPAAREKEAEFCWQTKNGDASPFPYVFTAVATDDNCQLVRMAARTYTITVKPVPKYQRKYQKLAGNRLRFEAIAPDSQKALYQWTIRDSSNTGTPIKFTYSLVDTVSFSKPGKYIAEFMVVISPANCPKVYRDTIIIDGKVSIDPVNEKGGVFVYPNPGNGYFNIVLDENETYTGMSVYNTVGQEIYSGNIGSQLDIRAFPQGIYSLRIQGLKGSYFTVIVKE